MRTFEEEWNDIEENFDWPKAQKVMIALDWTWFGVDGIPGISDMKETAKRLLESVYQGSSVTCASGGFKAQRCGDWMGLAFVAVEWDTCKN